MVTMSFQYTPSVFDTVPPDINLICKVRIVKFCNISFQVRFSI